MKKKYKSFGLSMINLMLIVLLVFAYQAITKIRIQADEIASLKASNEKYEIEIKEAKSLLGEDEEETGGAGYKDGVYTGSSTGFGGNVSVEVSIEGGNITDITITSAAGEDAAYLDMAKRIIDNIIDQQSADVDTISGATYTANGIRNAVIIALQGAV